MRQGADLLVLACRRLASLGMPACIKDSCLRYVAVNEAYAALFGANASAFANRDASEIGGDDVPATRDERERRAIVFGDDASIDFVAPNGFVYQLSIEQFITDDGQIYIYENLEKLQPVDKPRFEAANDSGGRPDLTDLKAMLEGLDQPLALKDDAGQIVFANHAYELSRSNPDGLVSEATAPFSSRLQEVLEAAADYLDVGLVILDPENCILYRNESFIRIGKSYAGDVAVGKSATELLYRAAENGYVKGVKKDDRQAMERWLKTVLWEYQQPLFETVHETDDGRWIQISNRRMPNGYMVGLRIDVTESKTREACLIKQKDDLLLFQAILDGLPVPVFARDENHLMAYSNTAGAAILGKEIDDILGKDETAVFGDDAKLYHDENEDILVSGGLSVEEREIPNSDGSTTSILSRIGRVVTSSDKRYVIGSLMDVTTLKMREKELVEARRAAEIVKTHVLEVMNSVSYAVFVIRQSDLIVEMANEAAKAAWKDTPLGSVSGHSFVDMIKHHFASGIVDTDREDVERIIQGWIESIRSGNIEPRESVLKDGTHLQIRGAQISGERVLVTISDVTELRARDREIDEARNRLAKTGALMNEALVAMDQGLLLLSGTVIKLSNEAVGRLLKLPSRFTRIGANWADAFAYCGARGDFGDDPVALLKTAWKRAVAGETFDFISSIEGERWLRFETRPTADAGTMVLLTDITELQNRQSQLEKLVVRAEKADRTKSEFLAHVSHEIRTPMNGVLGMAELLGRSDLDTHQKTFVDAIAKSGKSLLTVINDILDFSQIESGLFEPRLSNFDPLESVDDMAALMVAKAEDKNIEIVVRHAADLPSRVRGDGPRFRQIIYKLIDNAVKFTEHGHVEILLTTGAPIGERPTLCLRVSDTGIGISAERLNEIFEKFFRADEASRSGNEGMGLGLAITNGLVRLLGGQVGVESTPGKGSSFTVTLPFDILDAHHQSTDIPAHILGSRILVIDSVAANRDAMTELLEHWGLDTRSAANASEGLAILEAAAAVHMDIDAALINSRVLEGGIRDFVEAMRRGGALKDLPIILMTPSNLTDLQPIAELNLQAHLLKPVRSSLLLNTVCEVVANKRDPQTSKLVADLRKQMEQGPQPTEDLPLEILIAEDNEINIQVYTEILASTKYRFKIVKDGVQAVDAWRQDRPLVVIMDINMPLMDGFDAARAIRMDEEKSGLVRTPIIGITTHSSDEVRRSCLDVGMDDYLPKPINPERLAEKLENWLGIARDAGGGPDFSQSA